MTPTRHEDLRARRRRETRERIAEVGLRMFDEQGYDATTMQAVAEAAGVSPRTLFHYFPTKDQILRYWLSPGFAEELGPAVLAQRADRSPWTTARAALAALIARHETEHSPIVDRVLASTGTLRASKQATFAEWEDALHAALRERWPDPERDLELGVVAMASIGALRLALERRREQGEEARPLVEHLDAALARLGPRGRR